ncbi:hypothetical protein G6F68_012761 [Rhizopus microsporus]|nr:hypothetical protein G6F68_012761 [Rhizopus microsporus]
MAGQVFGGRLDRDVRAQRQRLVVQAAAPGIVGRDQHAMAPRRGGQRGQTLSATSAWSPGANVANSTSAIADRPDGASTVRYPPSSEATASSSAWWVSRP